MAGTSDTRPTVASDGGRPGSVICRGAPDQRVIALSLTGPEHPATPCHADRATLAHPRVQPFSGSGRIRPSSGDDTSGDSVTEAPPRALLRAVSMADRKVARVLVRSVFRTRAGIVLPAQVMAAAGLDGPAPEAGEELACWARMRELARAHGERQV